MDANRGPLKRSQDLIVEELDDEVLVYDSNADRAHCLSPDAARVWRRCDGRTPIDGLAAQIGLSAERVQTAVDELERCELLEEPSTLSGHTRRELTVKLAKVGAAAAAVPLIVSVSAPTPAQAATLAFCATFSSGNCGGTGNGCSGTVGCCCCTPPLHSPYAAGSPCQQRDPTSSQCKTCVPCDQQSACQDLYHHSGNGCGNESNCPAP